MWSALTSSATTCVVRRLNMTKSHTTPVRSVQTDPGLGDADVCPATDPGPAATEFDMDPEAVTDPGPEEANTQVIDPVAAEAEADAKIDEILGAFRSAKGGKIARVPNPQINAADSGALGMEDRVALAYRGNAPRELRARHLTPPPEESILVNATPVGPPSPGSTTAPIRRVTLDIEENPIQSNTEESFRAFEADRSPRNTFKMLVQSIEERENVTHPSRPPLGERKGRVTLIVGLALGSVVALLTVLIFRSLMTDRPPVTSSPVVTAMTAPLPPASITNVPAPTPPTSAAAPAVTSATATAVAPPPTTPPPATREPRRDTTPPVATTAAPVPPPPSPRPPTPAVPDRPPPSETELLK